MTRKKLKGKDSINVIFCDRCGSLYQRIKVTDKIMMPMCTLCHMELFKYFVDEDGKFVHFGDWDLFSEIAEKLEAHTDKLGFIPRSSFEKQRSGLYYDDFVNLIRERTKKMSLIEPRFKPHTEITRKRSAESKEEGDE